MFAQSLSTQGLVDALNEGIARTIQTSGKALPTSAIQSDSPFQFQCEWTDFSSDLCCPVLEGLRQYFPPLDGSEVGSNGRPLLYSACLGLLLSQRDGDEFSSNKKSPLSTFVSVVSFLLDNLEVDPNQPTQSKGACLRPPLHLVARSCHPSAVRLLLSRGADPTVTDEEGWTPLMACCMPDIPRCEEGGPATKERTDTIETLLNGATHQRNVTNVDARNFCGFGALHYACEGLNSALIQCLLEEGGADATLRTVWGQSCIGIVKSQSHINQEEAATCETMLKSHLKKTGDLERIHSFLEEEEKAINLMDLVENVLLPASRRQESEHESQTLAEQDQRILHSLMIYLDLDPRALFQEKYGGNLYEVIHQQVINIIPCAYRQVYTSNPTTFEREIITCTSKVGEIAMDGVRHVDGSILMSKSFHLHRERGHVAQQLELLTDLIVGPLQRLFAFGIPGDATLKEITACAPSIVEMGAGTGYWSYMLSRFGADIVAFDAHPLTQNREGKNRNMYFGSQSYFPVQEGVASTVFGSPAMVDRALLVVWPNNPDAEDNRHVAVEQSILPAIWDFECLQQYHEMGGETVIFVGERETRIQLMPDATAPDCGFCASRKFQLFLENHYELEAALECPRWWMKEDDATIWKRT